MKDLFGVTLPTVRRFSLCKRKSLGLWLVHNSELHVEVYLNNLRSVPCQHVLSLMSLIISNQEKFQINSSIHNINTRNKHHLHKPNVNLSCFPKVHFMLASRFSIVYHQV
jgi:hypothetical protein